MDDIGRKRIRSLEVQVDKLIMGFRQHNDAIEGIHKIVQGLFGEFNKFSNMTEETIKQLGVKDEPGK